MDAEKNIQYSIKKLSLHFLSVRTLSDAEGGHREIDKLIIRTTNKSGAASDFALGCNQKLKIALGALKRTIWIKFILTARIKP
jgi:hypothetical protein